MHEPIDVLTSDRAACRAHLAVVEAQLRDLIDSARDSNLDDEHDPEGATIAFEREQLSAVRAQAVRRLAEIDAALRRLASGSYGECVVCGEQIGAERLAARPSVAACVRCAAAPKRR